MYNDNNIIILNIVNIEYYEQDIKVILILVLLI